jgi:hypothetical protein
MPAEFTLARFFPTGELPLSLSKKMHMRDTSVTKLMGST